MKLLAVFGLLFVCLVTHVVYLSSVLRRQTRNREERRKAIEPNVTVSEVGRLDGKERIRIIRCSDDAFGAVLERRSGDEWHIERIAGPGAVFESAETAEAQAVKLAPWFKKKRLANRCPS